MFGLPSPNPFSESCLTGSICSICNFHVHNITKQCRWSSSWKWGHKHTIIMHDLQDSNLHYKGVNCMLTSQSKFSLTHSIPMKEVINRIPTVCMLQLSICEKAEDSRV